VQVGQIRSYVVGEFVVKAQLVERNECRHFIIVPKWKKTATALKRFLDVVISKCRRKPP
jgi:hypothetical protein